MKRMTLFLLGLFMVSTLQAQNIKPEEVPDPVLHQFSFLYPDATKVSWQLNKANYEADFKNDKKITRAVFQSDGGLVCTTTEIKVCALPRTALGYLLKDDPERKIEAANIHEDREGVITFNAVVDKTDFWFDWRGEYLSSGELALMSEE